MRRIWLHDVGVFEIVPNTGHGSCLFQAISQALTFSTKFHYEFRTSTVEYMTSRKWAHKLNQFPDFWKHKIITQWLRRERAHFMRLQNHHSCRARESVSVFGWCRHFTKRFKERRRLKRFERIKALHQMKRCDFSSKDITSIFYKFMSRKNEPGTKFELEAAANLLRFHFDYLQMIPLENETIQYDDILNNNNADPEELKNIEEISKNIPLDQIQQSINSNGNSDSVDENANNKIKTVNDTLFIPEESKNGNRNVLTVKMAMYEFFSCRNNNCEFFRGTNFDQDHYYFLHSPSTYNRQNVKVNFESRRDSQCNECGHWELLLPVSVKKEPVPLHRKIFGISYEVFEAARNYKITRCGHQRETTDKIARAIEAHIQKNPNLIPPQDPEWPADEDDDYMGCAATLRDSFIEVEDKNCCIDKKERNLNEILAALPLPTNKRFSIRRIRSAVKKWKAYTNFVFLKRPPSQPLVVAATDRDNSETDTSQEGSHHSHPHHDKTCRVHEKSL